MAEITKTEVDGNGGEEINTNLEKVDTEQKTGEETYDEVVTAIDDIINPAEAGGGEEINKEEEAGKKVEDDAKETTDTDKEVKEESTLKKDEESDTTEKLVEQVKALNLPNRLIQAAKRNHLSDEEIIGLGDKAELVLTRLAANSDEVSRQLGELGRKIKATVPAKKEDKESTLAVKINDDDVDEVKELKGLIQTLAGQVSDLKKMNQDRVSTISQQEILDRDKKIDSVFDSRATEFPEFGNTKSLTESQTAIRQKLFANADDIMVGAKVNGREKTWEEALVEALSIYESESPKKKVSREQLLKEVDSREKSLISRASSKRKSAAVKDPHKEEVEAVRKVLDKGEGW